MDENPAKVMGSNPIRSTTISLYDSYHKQNIPKKPTHRIWQTKFKPSNNKFSPNLTIVDFVGGICDVTFHISSRNMIDVNFYLIDRLIIKVLEFRLFGLTANSYSGA